MGLGHSHTGTDRALRGRSWAIVSTPTPSEELEQWHLRKRLRGATTDGERPVQRRRERQQILVATAVGALQLSNFLPHSANGRKLAGYLLFVVRSVFDDVYSKPRRSLLAIQSTADGTRGSRREGTTRRSAELECERVPVSPRQVRDRVGNDSHIVIGGDGHVMTDCAHRPSILMFWRLAYSASLARRPLLFGAARVTS
jgi:hypothetical protein